MCRMFYKKKKQIPQPFKKKKIGQLAFVRTFADLRTRSSPDLILDWAKRASHNGEKW